MKRIVILFSGEGSNLVRLIEELHLKHCVVESAITNNPQAPGIAKAQALGVRVEVIDHTLFESREAFDAALVRAVHAHAPDLTVLAGFMRILTPVFTLHVKAINLHPSLLPKFKGARAIERSFESGERVCGVSVHWVSHELDGGEVIAQETFERSAQETLEGFTCSIRAIEHRLLAQTVKTLLQ
ncbi:MAG: phosphoribosylglycinamide formyltransferase [Campylobacterales bacterium]|nr:phosphoribosylglycinamide formyltransferase [Campylobacterales bacterium]